MLNTEAFGRQKLYAAIELERQRQDAEWGGPAHDDEHSIQEWVGFIDRQSDAIYRTRDAGEARSRLVKVAALAVAAIESSERKAGT